MEIVTPPSLAALRAKTAGANPTEKNFQPRIALSRQTHIGRTSFAPKIY
ncbi:MAG: hypothetical protein ACR2HG_06340 [Pyrinomonadaceae bacterium]